MVAKQEQDEIELGNALFGARLAKLRKEAGVTQVELAKKLVRNHWEVVVVGSKAEMNIGVEIVSLVPEVINLIGQTSPRDLFVLMKYFSKDTQ